MLHVASWCGCAAMATKIAWRESSANHLPSGFRKKHGMEGNDLQTHSEMVPRMKLMGQTCHEHAHASQRGRAGLRASAVAASSSCQM